MLNKLKDSLLRALEAAGMAETRQRPLDDWAQFEKDGGIGNTTFDPRFDHLESKPLTYLDQLISDLRLLAEEQPDSNDAYELAALERVLWKTSVILRDQDIVPEKEKDVRDVMHKYLRAFFTEYVTDVQITGIVTNFKPDSGVRNLRTAIEFKFADTEDEIRRDVRQILEDVSGYSGSQDWTRFYTVIYQTEPFESSERIQADPYACRSFRKLEGHLGHGAG